MSKDPVKAVEGNDLVPVASGTSTGGPSPQLRPKGSKLKKLKSRPHLKRSPSTSGSHNKLVFSVDDDVNDDIIEEGDETSLATEREYLEGYNDALRALYKRKNLASAGTLFKEGDNGKGKNSTLNQTPADELDIENIEQDIVKNLIEVEDKLKLLPREEEAEVEVEDNASTNSSASLDTLESLNLRERQDAINSTHPFGIKIWKPSLYKKKRSVATRADEDIHDYELRKPTWHISWGTSLCNMIWSITFGLVLWVICMLGALIVFVFSGFGIRRSSRGYVRTFLKIGNYMRSPFGVFVLLNKDKNYIEEDQLDGRSLVEFQRWRDQEEGRLFFNPPRRNTSHNEARPLLKDHAGRPVYDQYSSLHNENDITNDNGNDDSLVDENDENQDITDIKVRLFGRGSWSSGRFIFYIYFYCFLQPILYILMLICWLFVFTIPMARVIQCICDHLRRHPLALHFELEKKYYAQQGDEHFQGRRKHQSIIMCTYRSCGFHYYKYTIDGTNIFFINMIFVVIFVILDYYILKERMGFHSFITESSIIFCACLIAVVPLAYFIGQAVASISAQSSMGVGAVINAFFSTVVEIFLYSVALNQSKGKLVEGSLIGSILGGVLLLPGLSMCGGALKRKTQRYNPRSAGVSSTMLLFAMVMMFAPSMFYQIYGTYEIRCTKCFSDDDAECSKCRFVQSSFTLDALYHNVIKPLSLVVALALFLAYITGLYFTLRTHASLIWATNSHEVKKEENFFPVRSPSITSIDNSKNASSKHQQPLVSSSSQSGTKTKARQSNISPSVESSSKRIPSKSSDILKSSDAQQSTLGAPDISKKKIEPKEHEHEENAGGGHDAPNWSRKKSTVILLGATLLYAIIAEILVDTVDEVLKNYPINPKFLGLTVFALVPNTTEFLNAISFAVNGNVALSMEIGSAYALQVVLIQIPSLVIYCIVKNFEDVEKIFTLIFPRWDIVATLVSIFLFTYIYAEGKSNYFKGVILILIYMVVMIGFWFNDTIEDLEYSGGNFVSALGTVYQH